MWHDRPPASTGIQTSARRSLRSRAYRNSAPQLGGRRASCTLRVHVKILSYGDEEFDGDVVRLVQQRVGSMYGKGGGRRASSSPLPFVERRADDHGFVHNKSLPPPRRRVALHLRRRRSWNFSPACWTGRRSCKTDRRSVFHEWSSGQHICDKNALVFVRNNFGEQKRCFCRSTQQQQWHSLSPPPIHAIAP